MRDQLCCGRLPSTKQEPDSCLTLQRTPEILAKHAETVCLVLLWVILFCRSYKLPVEVSPVTKHPKRTIESFSPAWPNRSWQHTENKTAGSEREVVGGGVGGLIKVKCPISFSASPNPTSYFALPMPWTNCVKRLTGSCRCVGAAACDNPAAVLLWSWLLTSPGMECHLLIANFELSIGHKSQSSFCILDLAPRAISTSIANKAPFQIQSTGG